MLAEPSGVEAQHLAEWLGNQLLPEASECRAIFTAQLQEILIERHRGHWYPHEPHRGCGYRALTCTPQTMDPLIQRAAQGSGIKDMLQEFCKTFTDAGELICWINPGEVKVLRGKAHELLYTDGAGSDNPYAKLRINIEPTKLNVKVDVTGHRDMDCPSSPVSSTGGLVGAEGFGYGQWRGHGSGVVTPRGEVSPTESPSQSWRAASHCPPAMAPLPAHMSTQGIFQGGEMLDGSVLGSMGMGGGRHDGMGAAHSSPMRFWGGPMQ
mmetsp:Transcript_29920/g.51161  ORF Transcript_29920/g.51161 Transcript_29920/m.51161 type:complete len:266 (-) Transcript_29920:102-899(-)